MNEQWYLSLAQDRQRELIKEANQARLLKEAGIQDSLPGAAKAIGLVLLSLPFAIILLRAVLKV